MKQRGRKSASAATALKVVAGAFGEKPAAPAELTKEQKAIWEKVVSSEHPDFFKTAAVKALLVSYCRHSATADHLDKQVEKAVSGPVHQRPDLEDFDRLLKMRDREVRASVNLATKMRLTNQSRYQTTTAANKANQVPARKPWDA